MNRIASLLAGFVVTWSVPLLAQMSSWPILPGGTSAVPIRRGEDLAKEYELKARAVEIRTLFVHRYGTKEEIEAFDHPRLLNARGKPPTHLGIIDLAPAQVFDRVFIHVQSADYHSALERNPSRDAAAQHTTAGGEVASSAQRMLDRVVPFGSVIMGKTMEATCIAQETAAAQREINTAAERMTAWLEDSLALVLTKEELAKYVEGDYRVRARLVFKAGLTLLEIAGTPNPFILMVNDPSGVTVKNFGTLELPGGAATFSYFYPEAVSSWPQNEVARWQLTADLQKRFMQEGFDAFSKADSSAFLARQRETLIDPSGIMVFGKTADKQYQGATADGRKEMEKAAIMVSVASEVISGTRVGLECHRESSPGCKSL